MKCHLPYLLRAGNPTQTREEILYEGKCCVTMGAPQGGRGPPPNFRLALLPSPPPRVSHLQLIMLVFFAGLVQAPVMMATCLQLKYPQLCTILESVRVSTRINNHVYVVVTILLPCILSLKIAVTYISVIHVQKNDHHTSS